MRATFATLLAATPAHSLRAIATYLGVRRRGDDRKAAWIAAIRTYWQPATGQTRADTALSLAALAAYHQLRQAGQLPAELFWQSYGPLRLPKAPTGDGLRTDEQPRPPWQAPQTISEVLYYSGLLHPVGHRQILKAPWLTTPTDLQLADPLTTQATGTGQMPAGFERPATNPWSLLHDVAQYLIDQLQHPQERLLHGYWLPRSRCQALNRRLLRPAPLPLPGSHKATPALALLTFLVHAAALSDPAGMTAAGWQWLAAPPTAQLQTIWQGWVTAPTALRARHAQEGAFLPAPWPRPLLQWLGQQAAPFSAGQAAGQLLGSQPALADYFVAHLAAVDDLAQLLAPLFAGELCQLGLLIALDDPAAAATAQHDPQRLYTLSALGGWLLHPMSPPPLIQPPAGFTGRITTQTLAASPVHLPIQLPVPLDLPFAIQARLAIYTDYTVRDAAAAGPPTQHTYTLSAATVARAAAQQQPLAPLVDVLQHLHYALDQPQMTELQAAYAAGRALRLDYLPVLRSDNVARMAALQQDGRLDPLWGELLGPHAVTLLAALPEVHQQLKAAGYAVLAPTPLPALAQDEQSARHASDLLWLAGRLYQALAEHLPSLTPLPNAVLDQLWQPLAPAAQALRQSQFEQIHAQLGQLLDGYHLMPPTIPALYATDGAAIRRQLESAIATQQALEIRYYSAGRNLFTQRRVDPYWIEERHGIDYLRAYCHNAGRVLTFRLDRIQALESAKT